LVHSVLSANAALLKIAAPIKAMLAKSIARMLYLLLIDWRKPDAVYRACPE